MWQSLKPLILRPILFLKNKDVTKCYRQFCFYLAGVKLGEACTIVLRGATQQILDEAERSLHDALCVLSQTVKETKTVFGGGNVQTEILYQLVSFWHWRNFSS